MKKTVLERFEEKYCPEPNTGCWLWTGGTSKEGYGRIVVGGKKAGTHRVSWELHRGPIPDGLCVLHRCDTPPCVNPGHLFLGDKKANYDDMVAKGRERKARGANHEFTKHPEKSSFAKSGQKGSQNWQAKLREDDIFYIRQLYRSGLYQKYIARFFGISIQHVSDIVNNQRWGHLPDGRVAP